MRGRIRCSIVLFCLVLTALASAAACAVAAESGTDAPEQAAEERGRARAEAEEAARKKAADAERKQEVVRHAWTAQLNMLQSFRESPDLLDARPTP